MLKGVDADGNLITSGDKTFATLKAGSSSKKSGGKTGAIVGIGAALLVVVGGSLLWIKRAGTKPQWSGYEPVVNSSAAPGQEVKPDDNIIKPGSNPPA